VELLRSSLLSQAAERLEASEARRVAELTEAEHLAHAWAGKCAAAVAEGAASAERLEGALLAEMSMKEEAERVAAALREEIGAYEALGRRHTQEVKGRGKLGRVVGVGWSVGRRDEAGAYGA
jgi:HPt (histidine-containing phosphotransfer) domain-containing protein